MTAESAGATDKVTVEFSPGLVDFLAVHDVSIAFTSYQSGRLYLLGRAGGGKLALHEALWPQAMGVVGDAQRLYLGTLTQLVRLENVLAPGQVANGAHDKVFVPRNAQTFGHIDFHELGIRGNGTVVVVNTRFSCLCEPSLVHSFRPVWQPPFVSEITPTDRCHLNGLAMADGEPAYVTAVATTDSEKGWRDHRDGGGVVIDARSDEIVCQGLSMPHSPRWREGELWLLNSGTGELGRVDLAAKRFEPVASAPGFLRGLDFVGGHAIVGLSKPRDGRFEGLPLDSRLAEQGEEAWCGLQVIDLADGTLREWLRFGGPITELFAVCVLPGVRSAITLGPQSQEIREFITFETGR
jgi:uncharacterized protein (TIGR03032 family)